MAVTDGIKYGTSRVARTGADPGGKKVAVGINCEADAFGGIESARNQKKREKNQ